MKPKIELRAVRPSDLDTFFQQQLDPAANHMAAFTAQDPTDQAAFAARWAKIRADETITMRTILFDGAVAGHIGSHGWFGKPEVSYWLGREYWGQGIATQALRLLLTQEKTRPLYARAAKDNIASLRVLEKCGFAICGEDKGFANARGQEIEEYLLRLD